VACLFMAKAAKLLAGLQDQSGFGFVIRRTHTNINTHSERGSGKAHAHYANITPTMVLVG